MGDWNYPQIDENYITFVQSVKDRDVDSIRMLASDQSAATNIPVGAIRYHVNGKLQRWNGTVWVDLVWAVEGGGTGATTPGGVISSLGLGSMSTQNNNAVNITGGSITGVTLDAGNITSGTVPLNRGGTGASLGLGSAGTVLLSNGTGVIFAPGSSIANLDAGKLTQGIIPDARFPNPLPPLNAGNLGNLNASQLLFGTVPRAALGTGSVGEPYQVLRADGQWSRIVPSTFYDVSSWPLGTWNNAVSGFPSVLQGYFISDIGIPALDFHLYPDPNGGAQIQRVTGQNRRYTSFHVTIPGNSSFLYQSTGDPISEIHVFLLVP